METRVSDDGDSIRRRRRCENCDKRFTTYERVELNLPTVVKHGGVRAEYDGRKLRASMQLALRKRRIAPEAIDAAVHRIEDKLLSLGLREVETSQIGELVMRELKKLDKVAYVRFASVYKNFEDVDDFTEAIQEMRPVRKRK